MMTTQATPVTGDIVGVFLPHHKAVGQPGPVWRKAMVLALEIDPNRNSLEGLWLCRLSDRIEKARRWDYQLNAASLTGEADFLAEQTWQMRTHQIHLLPATSEYFSDQMHIYGHADASVLQEFLPKLDMGLQGSLYTESYGPREQLPQTVVATSMKSPNQYPYFGYVRLIEDAIRQEGTSNSRSYEFGKARVQQHVQIKQEALRLHQLFLGAGSPGFGWANGHAGHNPPVLAPSL